MVSDSGHHQPVSSTFDMYDLCFSTEWFPFLQNLALHDLRACYKNRTTGPALDLRICTLKKIPRWITCSIKSEKHCFRRTTDASWRINLHKDLYFSYYGNTVLWKVHLLLKILLYKKKQRWSLLIHYSCQMNQNLGQDKVTLSQCFSKDAVSLPVASALPENLGESETDFFFLTSNPCS